MRQRAKLVLFAVGAVDSNAQGQANISKHQVKVKSADVLILPPTSTFPPPPFFPHLVTSPVFDERVGKELPKGGQKNVSRVSEG